jgi:UDP-2,3-diacylglucosamine pyrophosphatase LpxH
MLTNSLLTNTEPMPAQGRTTSGLEARSEPAAASIGASKSPTAQASAARSIMPRIRRVFPQATLSLEANKARAQTRDPQRRFRSLFLSDTHLGAKGCRADRLLDFLNSHDAEVIYLVGDIFDNRQPFRSNWSPVHDAVVQNLLSKVREGQRIVYLPGNHDEVFRRHYGVYFDCIEVVERALHTAADGKRYLVLHGDCFDVVVKHLRWLSWIGGHIDGAVRSLNAVLNRGRRLCGLADWSLMEIILSRLNRLITRGDRFEHRLTALAREHAAAGVICGHLHSAAIHEEFGVVYANCGDWIDSCTAIAEDADGRLQIIGWKNPQSAPVPQEFLSEAEAASVPAS